MSDYSSGSTVITGTVQSNINSISPYGTLLKVAYGEHNAGAGNTVIGTVPAGKTWYIVSASINQCVANAATARDNIASIQANGSTIIACGLITLNSAGAGGTVANAYISAPTGCALVGLTQGQTITVVDTGVSSHSLGTVWYIEV